MGIYISCFIDNNIFENDMEYTVNKLAAKLNRKIFLSGDFNDNDYPEKDVACEYITVRTEEYKSINEAFENEKMIIMSIYDNLYELDDIWVSKSAIYIKDFWWKWYVFEDYLLGNNKYFDCKIEAIKHFGKLFDSTEFIILGDDHYDSEIEDKLSEGEYIKNIVNDKKYNIVTEIPITPDEMGGYVYYKKYREKIDDVFNYDEWYEYFRHNEIDVEYPLLKQDNFIEDYQELIDKHNELFNGYFYYMEHWNNLMYRKDKNDKNSDTYYIFGHIKPEKLAKYLKEDIANGVNTIPERFKEHEMKD